jgi:hypothetical protein
MERQPKRTKGTFPRGFSGFVSGRDIGRGEDGGGSSLCTFVYAVGPKVVPKYTRCTFEPSVVLPSFLGVVPFVVSFRGHGGVGDFDVGI